jgi:hypothetical protein
MDRRIFSVLREIARREGVSVKVRGKCMEPVLGDGADVSVTARRIYFPGDVVVYRRRSGELVAHRVLGWRRAGLVTQGDHCDEHDPPVPPGEIVGAVDTIPVLARHRLRAILQLARIVMRRLTR